MGCGYYRNVTIERQQRHAIATAPGRVVDIAVYRPCAAPANFYAFVRIHLRVDSFQRGFSFSARSRDGEEIRLRAIVSCLLPFRETGATDSLSFFFHVDGILVVDIDKGEKRIGNSREISMETDYSNRRSRDRFRWNRPLSN